MTLTCNRSTAEYRAAFRAYLADKAKPNQMQMLEAEARALDATQGSTGGYAGYAMLPEETAAAFIEERGNRVKIRQLATRFVTDAHSLGVPSVEAEIDDADWTDELDTGSDDSGLSLGKRLLSPHALRKRIKVSNKFLRHAVAGGEAFVNSRLAKKVAITEEKAFMTGSGINRPLGLFTASDSGIPTSRDVSTGNTTTAVTAAGLAAALYSLKEGYITSPTTRWIFHRTVVKQIRTLSGVWQPAIGDAPATILDVPYLMSEYAPSTMTAGLYVGLIGDLSHYYIADSELIGVQRLSELLAATDQSYFIGRVETDGMPVLAEAFARVQLAAA